MPSRPLDYVRANQGAFLRQLQEFVRIPSVSAQPKHAADVRRCADWLSQHLRQIGLAKVRVIPTPRHPIVFAEHNSAPSKPTVLVYGHYDVQPADPLSAWHTPPFDPVVRGNNIYGRGACDDKGQMFAHVKAIEAYLRTERELPVNVRCIFEGEEEIGSPHLKPWIRRHSNDLRADVAVLSDTRMLGPDQPALTYALRGSLSLELEVEGPRRDLHSGNFGGAIRNPLQALCEILGRLHDAESRIAVPGFYQRVRRWSDVERRFMARNGPSDSAILRDAGAEQGWGEPGYSLYERVTIRPALAITGITGGYQGPGAKAVLPARASAKLNLRLVPEQNPREIERLLRAHLAKIAGPGVRLTIRTQGSALPVVLDRRHWAMRAAANAYHRSFGTWPVFMRSGGTIPIVNLLHEELRIPTVLMGFALPDDRIHAPNEKFHLPNFYRGIAACIEFLEEVGRTGVQGPQRTRPSRSNTYPARAAT